MINYVILVCLTKTKLFSTSKSFSFSSILHLFRDLQGLGYLELRIVFEDLKQFFREIILRCSSKIPLGLSDCLNV